MKNIKCILAAIAAFISFCGVNAQSSGKAVLGIEEFSYDSSFSETDVEVFRNRLIKAIQRTGRVIVIDYLTATDEALTAGSTLTASLNRLDITREMYEDKETRKVGDKYQTVIKGRYPYLKATVNYTIKIIDSNDGNVLNQEDYTISKGSYKTYDRKSEFANWEEAHNAIIDQCINQDDISVLILNTFKVQGRILQIDKSDAKKAKTVFISLGADDGIKTRQILEVYKEFDIAGEISQMLVGEVEILEILGTKRCLAKVRKGGDEILKVLNSNGSLPVCTRDVEVQLFGGVK